MNSWTIGGPFSRTLVESPLARTALTSGFARQSPWRDAGEFLVDVGCGHDVTMSAEARLSGLIVCLEDANIDYLVGAAEVLVQEGFHTFSLPAQSAAFPEFATIYGTRARIGIHGDPTAAEIAALAAAGASFALLDQPDATTAQTAAAAGVRVYAQAMTPGEIRSVRQNLKTGVMVFPADVLGHVMATRLNELGLLQDVIPRGGLGAYAAGEWLKAGASAACIDATLLADALRGGDLEDLRDRCGSFVAVEEKHARKDQ